MHLPYAERLTRHVPATQFSPDPVPPPQGQLPLGLTPTGDLALVHERVRKDALDKWDVLTPRGLIRLHHGRVWFPEAAQSDFAASLKPTAWATAQFCQRLGIPAGYFRKCPAPLQDRQFNHWIRQAVKSQEVPAGDESGDEDDDPLARNGRTRTRPPRVFPWTAGRSMNWPAQPLPTPGCSA